MLKNSIVRYIGAATAAVLLSTAVSAKAVLLAYEGFDYDVGAVLDTSANGGFGFAQPWQPNLPSGGSLNNQIIIGGSFTYVDQYGNQLLTSGNRVWVTGDGTAAGDNTGGARANAQPFRGLNFARGTNELGETTWISWLAIRTGLPFVHTNTTTGIISYYGRAAGFQLFNVGTEQLSIGRASQNAENNSALLPDTWAMVNRGSATLTKASTVSWTNQVAFMLLRIDHANGVNNPGNDTAYLWINPPSLTNEPSIATANVMISASEFAPSDRDYNFNRIRLFAGNWNSVVGYGSMQLDEIRIGTEFLDVAPLIPEPSAIALAMLGGFGLLVLRLRRKQ